LELRITKSGKMRRLRRAYQRHQRENKRFKQRAVAAGMAAAITFGAGVSISKAAGLDPHQLVVKCDVDADLLANREEIAIGYKVFRADQNRNGIRDGVELAKYCREVVKGLPVYPPGPPPGDIYKIEHALDGYEQCEMCPQTIHMGGWEIINLKLGLKYPDPNDPMEDMFLPDLALHYMEHGSFDCLGSRHKGRVDIARLLRVLEVRFPYDPNEHELPVTGNDLDGDLLTDNEELSVGWNLYDADQNDNLIPDGPERANRCAEIIDALPVYEPNTPGIEEPYKINYFQKGIETCHICAALVNMGYWLVVNPKLGLSIQVPDIVCHYMKHGSFSFAGSVHGKGRIDVNLLVNVLGERYKVSIDLGPYNIRGDFNEDHIVNLSDLADFANQWLASTDPNEDECYR
jgi:hypothetical protein